MADVEILAQQVEAAPLNYTIPGGQEILLKCLAASFDGSAAGSSWQPAIQVVGPSGQVLRTFPLSEAVAAGASADVTWFPRSGGGVSGAGAGIVFDKYPQDGHYLYTHTDTPSPANSAGTDLVSSAGIQLTDASNRGINRIQTGGGGINDQDTGGGGFNVSTNGGVDIVETSGIGILIAAAHNGGISIRNLADILHAGVIEMLQFSAGGISITDSGGGGVTISESGLGTLRIENHGNGFNGAGIVVQNDGAGLLLISQPGSGELVIDTFNGPGGLLNIQAGPNGILITAAAGGSINMGADTISATGNLTSGQSIQERIKTGAAWAVIDDSTPATRFQVDANGHVHAPSLPTSSAGLSAGELWNSAGVVHVV